MSDRAELVDKYFIKTPEKPDLSGEQIMMTLGAIGAVIGLIAFPADNVCLGILGLFGGGGLLIAGGLSRFGKTSLYKEAYKKAEPKASDQQMDEWKNSALSKIRQDSLGKLDLMREQLVSDPDEPIMVVGPASNAMIGLGKDNFVRFSKYNILVVHLTDYHLGAYQCQLNMATGRLDSESTKEYHYKNIVSVSTQTSNSSAYFVLTIDGEDKSIADYQSFALSVASGEKIEVTTSFPQLKDIFVNGRLAPTGSEKAIRAIRAMLREKTSN